MKCQNCYCDVKETDKYCKNCGQEIKQPEKSVVEFNNPNYKRRNSHPWLIVGVIIFIISVTFIGTILFFIKYDEEHPSEIQTNEQQIDKRVKTKSDQINFKGITFTVPADLKANSTDNQLFIYGKNNDWVGVVMLEEAKYNTLVEQKDQLKTILSNQNNEYDINEATVEEKEYGGKRFLTIKNIKSSIYHLEISYAKADENNVYVISITKSDGTQLDEKDRKTMYSLVASGYKNV